MQLKVLCQQGCFIEWALGRQIKRDVLLPKCPKAVPVYFPRETRKLILTRRWGARDKRKPERRMLQVRWLEYC
jgi:hypothetical protein